MSTKNVSALNSNSQEAHSAVWWMRWQKQPVEKSLSCYFRRQPYNPVLLPIMILALSVHRLIQFLQWVARAVSSVSVIEAMLNLYVHFGRFGLYSGCLAHAAFWVVLQSVSYPVSFSQILKSRMNCYWITQTLLARSHIASAVIESSHKSWMWIHKWYLQTAQNSFSFSRTSHMPKRVALPLRAIGPVFGIGFYSPSFHSRR